MSQQLASDEISFASPHSDDMYKTIKKVTIILSVITLIELGLGLTIYSIGQGSHLSVMLIKGVVTILSLAKAFYITSYFMHLGDEVRSMMMTIVVPLGLFVWFIIAFLYEGNSWKNMKNTRAGLDKEKVEQTTPAREPGTEK
ncbi:MAG: cytochrome C oxidase subunit IV family protein [Bacteroidota bacterium]